MKVSIITAAYNEGATIAETLSSVADQSYPNIEHIVIDGGSTDNTLSIVQDSGSKVSMVLSMPDRGLYHALNRGVCVATGDVILCLNAGDRYVDSGVLARYVDVFERLGVDAVFGNLYMTDAAHRQQIVRRYRVEGDVCCNLARGLMPPHPTLAVRRSVHERIGLYDSSYTVAGDFDFFLRLFCVNDTRYHFLDDYVVYMPVGGMSNRSWWTAVQNTMEMRRACKQNGVASSFFQLAGRLPTKLAQSRSTV